MERITLGLVYVLLEEMVEYIRLTNPWGSGESNSSSSSGGSRIKPSVGKNDLGTLAVMSGKIAAVPTVPVRNIRDFGEIEQRMMRAEFGGN